MTEGVYLVVVSELILCGAWALVEEIRREYTGEDIILPPGCYRLVWDTQYR